MKLDHELTVNEILVHNFVRIGMPYNLGIDLGIGLVGINLWIHVGIDLGNGLWIDLGIDLGNVLQNTSMCS